MWTCPNCAAQNDDNAPMCVVCATGSPAKTYGTPVDPWAAPADPADQPGETPASTGPLTVTGPIPTAPSVDPWAIDPAAPIEPTTAEPAPAPTSTGTALPPTTMAPVTGTSSAKLPLNSPYGGRSGHYPPSVPQAPVKRRVSPLRWALPILLVALVGLGILIGRTLSDRDRTTAGPSTPATTPTKATRAPSSAPASATPSDSGPTENSLVTISHGVTDDRAAGVAKMLDTYFSGINQKDYDKVGSVLDPDGSVDPTDADDMQKLKDGTRSTSDSDVTLVSLNSGGGGLLAAEVTFESNQDAGDGPKGRENEKCTDWDIVYTINAQSPYKIRKSKADNSPCKNG